MTYDLEQIIAKYLDSPHRIGFMDDSFPLSKEMEEIVITKKWRGMTFGILVKICEFSFGNGKFTTHGIQTEPFNPHLGEFLFFGGFGSSSHIDECKMMREAVVDVCREKNIVPCQEYNTWPYVKVFTQPLKNT